MTQGAGQGPEVRTATLRDFRVPAYVQAAGQDAVDPASAAGTVAPLAPGAVFPDEPEPVAPGRPLTAERPPTAQEPFARQAPGVQGTGATGQADSTGPAAAAVPPAPTTAQFPATAAAPDFSAAGEEPAPTEEDPDGYTPTQRDLPVINRGDTVQVPVVRDAPGPPANPDSFGPLFVVGDVHGYVDELTEALREQGLIDAEGNWAAGTARLWFLGDFTDRGPDGIGVIDLVMRLSAEAAAAGGYCKALMGNHELLLLGARRFGDTPVDSGAGTATFQAAWLLNGGQKTDMERLQEHHLQWMSRLDAMEEADGHLLMHSDTTAYLDYGDSIEAVNDTVRETLTRNDANECWDLFRKLTKRFAFRDESGPAAVRKLLGTFGGNRVVHGHSPIPYLLGEVGSEDGEDSTGPVVEGPHVYAEGLAVAMDGGVTMAGKLLVRQLPLTP